MKLKAYENIEIIEFDLDECIGTIKNSLNLSINNNEMTQALDIKQLRNKKNISKININQSFKKQLELKVNL